MPEPLSQRADFMRTMKDTARSRFNAHKRLTNIDTQLTRLISLSTAFIIVLTICPYILKSPVYISDMINFFTVLFSIIILVASLLQYSSQNALNAEQFHRSALEINEIRRELQYVSDADASSLLTFTEKYSLVLQKYSINHSTVDYRSAIIDSYADYPWITQSQIREYKNEIWWSNLWPKLMIFTSCCVFVILLLISYFYPIYISAKTVS